MLEAVDDLDESTKQTLLKKCKAKETAKKSLVCVERKRDVKGVLKEMYEFLAIK